MHPRIFSASRQGTLVVCVALLLTVIPFLKVSASEPPKPDAASTTDVTIKESLTGGGLTEFDTLMGQLLRLEVPVDAILDSTDRDEVLQWAETWRTEPLQWSEPLCILAMRLGYHPAFSTPDDRAAARSIMGDLSSFDCIPKRLVLTDLSNPDPNALEAAITHTAILSFYHFNRPRTLTIDSEPANSVTAAARMLTPMPPHLQTLAKRALDKRPEILAMVEENDPCDLIQIALDFWDGRNGVQQDREVGELLIYRAAATHGFRDIEFEFTSRMLEFRRDITPAVLDDPKAKNKLIALQRDWLKSAADSGDPKAALIIAEDMEAADDAGTALEYYLIADAGGIQGMREAGERVATRNGHQITPDMLSQADQTHAEFLASSCAGREG